MVCGSSCECVAVPWVTSMQTLRGRIISIPISTGGDSRPMITIKLALLLFAPLEVEVLGFPSYLERFAVGAMDDPLERLQGTPLGEVLPPHRGSHAGH